MPETLPVREPAHLPVSAVPVAHAPTPPDLGLTDLAARALVAGETARLLLRQALRLRTEAQVLVLRCRLDEGPA